MSVTVPSLIEDVPGYLGFLPDDPGIVALLRFNERDPALAPLEALGSLTAIRPLETDLPAVTDGYTGPARHFTAGTGLIADDPRGRTLLPRTVSIQALVRWQAVAGTAVIAARGLGDSVLEHRSWMLRVVATAPGTGRLDWVWQDRAGNERVQVGGAFFVPASGFVLLSATREWVGDRFLLRYWAGETLLAENETADVEVGGGVGGHVTIGARAGGDPFRGAIDQLAVFSTALTQEHVSWVWRRLAYWQPGLAASTRALMPVGRARTLDRNSLVQRFLRARAGLLGVAAAAVELRALAGLPDRAFGARLEAWERVTGQTPAPIDSIATRRARVVAALRGEQGFSHAAIRAGLAPLLGVPEEDVDVFAGTNLTRGIDTDAWLLSGEATSTRVVGASALQFEVDTDANFTTRALDPFRCRTTALDECVLNLTLAAVTAGVGAEMGLWSQSNAFVGLRVEVDVGSRATLIDGPDGLQPSYFLSMRVRLFVRAGQVYVRVNDGPDVLVGPCPQPLGWAGVALVPLSADPPSARPAALLRDLVVYNPRSLAPLCGYVLSPTTADLEGARAQLAVQKPAHVFGAVITRRTLVCDDEDNGCDQAPLV